MTQPATRKTLGSAQTFSYDAEERMTQAIVAGTTTNYSYDAEGSRVQKAVSGGATTAFVKDDFGRLAGEYSSTGMTPVCFGDALHTIQDSTSPAHTSDDGTPYTRYNSYMIDKLGQAAHVLQESCRQLPVGPDLGWRSASPSMHTCSSFPKERRARG